ncbi:MAG: hypothetical protein JNL24_01620 [Bacteroidia bacterium]|nr:hypothetical protein [Bacteroidia bacterium]
MTNPFLFIFIAVLSMGMCSFQSKEEISNSKNELLSRSSWLIGTWVNTTPRGKMVEEWKKESDSSFVGKSYFIKTDTMPAEALKLVQRGNNLFYIPTVINQNGGLPVTFKHTISSESQIVFENPAHDFPQKISYTLINKDSLVAEISGTRNGQPKKIKFPMKRSL